MESRNAVEFRRAFSKLLEPVPSADNELKLKIACFLHKSLQIILNDENGAEAVVSCMPYVRQFLETRKLLYLHGSTENIVKRTVLQLLCDIPACILKPNFQDESLPFVHFKLFFDNEDHATLSLRILKKNWDSLNHPYSDNVHHLLQHYIRGFLNLSLNPTEFEIPSSVSTDIDFKEIRKICIPMPVELPSSEGTLLPIGHKSLRVLSKTSELLITACQKEVVDLLLPVLYTVPRIKILDKRNTIHFSTYTSEFLRMRISVLKLLCQIQLLKQDYENVQDQENLHKIAAAFLDTWEFCCSKRVYFLHYPLLSVFKLMVQPYSRNYLQSQISRMFSKLFIADENSLCLKHLRSESIGEFLNLTDELFSKGLLSTNPANSADRFSILEVLLQLLHGQNFPLKTQKNLCDEIFKVFHYLLASRNVSDSMRSQATLKIFQILILKLKSLSTLWRPNKANRYNGSTGRHLENSSFIKFLEGTTHEMNYESYEHVKDCAVEYKNICMVIIEIIKFIQNSLKHYRKNIHFISSQEREALLPLYSGLIKYSLRAIKVCNYQNTLINKDRFKEEKMKMFENIAAIMCILVEDYPLSYRQVLADCFSELLESVSIPYTAEVYFQYTLYESGPIFKITTTLMLEHLLDRLDALDGDSQEFWSKLPLYELIFNASSKRKSNANYDHLKQYLCEIVLKCSRVSVYTKEAFGLIKLMTLISLFVKQKSKGSTHALSTVNTEVLQNLKKWYSQAYDPVMKESILNICLNISTEFKDHEMILFHKELLPVIQNALASDSPSSIKRGLQILGKILDTSGENEIIPRDSIAEKLFYALRLDSPDINREAMEVVYKLGSGDWWHGKLAPISTKSPMIKLKSGSSNEYIQFPIEKIINPALHAATSRGSTDFTWQECFAIVESCLFAIMNDSERLSTQTESYPLPSIPDSSHKLVLMAMFACAFSDINSEMKEFMDLCISHYTTMAIKGDSKFQFQPYDLIDAIVELEKISCKLGSGVEAVEKIITYSYSILSKEMAWDCQFINYMVDKINSLFYHGTWPEIYFACKAMELFLNLAPIKWIYSNISIIIESLLTAVGDLEHRSTIPDNLRLPCVVIEKGIESLLESPEDAQLNEFRMQSLQILIKDSLYKQLTSTKKTVRKQVKWCLNQLHDYHNTGSQVAIFMSSFAETASFESKLALLDGLEYWLMHIDSPIGPGVQVDNFINCLLECCCQCREFIGMKSREDQSHSWENMKELYKTCLRVLSSLFKHTSQQLISILEEEFAALKFVEPDISYTAFECLKHIAPLCERVPGLIQYLRVQDVFSTCRDLSYSVYFCSAFQNMLDAEIKEKVFGELKNEIINFISSTNFQDKSKNFIKNYELHWVSYAPSDTFLVLFELYLKIRNQCVNLSYDFGQLILVHLTQSPMIFFNLLFNDAWAHVKEYQDYFTFFLRDASGETFRTALFQANLQALCHDKIQLITTEQSGDSVYRSLSLVIEITYYLTKHNLAFLKDSHDLAFKLWNIWRSAEFQRTCHGVDLKYYRSFKVYKWLAKSLLEYFKHHNYKVMVLFSLLLPLTNSMGQHFQFLTDFLLEECVNYDLDWKTHAFRNFVENFHDDIPLGLKLKILELLVIPAFAASFRKGELLPDSNLVHTFINKAVRHCPHVSGSDDMKVLMLQFSCLLVKYNPGSFNESCCSKRCLYNKILNFAKFCVWDGRRNQNMVLKSHGNLLLMYILKYNRNCDKNNISQVLSNLCDICPPNVQEVDLHTLKIFLEENVYNDSINFKEWGEEIVARNLKEHSFVHLLNMVNQCFEACNFDFRDFVTDLIEVADLLDFKQCVVKENKELIFQVIVTLLGKIKEIDKEKWVNMIFTDFEVKIPPVPEKDYFHTIPLKDRQCTGEDVCRMRHLAGKEAVLGCEEAFSGLLDQAGEEDSKMDIDSTPPAFIEDRLQNILSQFDKQEMKSSVENFKSKLTLSTISYLFEFACQKPDLEEESNPTDDIFFNKCWSYLKYILTRPPYDHIYLDLKWWFKNDSISNRVEHSQVLQLDLILHLLFLKLDLKEGYKTNLKALFKKISYNYYKNCKKLPPVLLHDLTAHLISLKLELVEDFDANLKADFKKFSYNCYKNLGEELFELLKKIDLESNKDGLGKKIHEKMFLHIIPFILGQEYLSGSIVLSDLLDTLDIWDLSLVSAKGLHFVGTEMCRFKIAEDVSIPIVKVKKVIKKLISCPYFDKFSYKIMNKVFYQIEKSLELKNFHLDLDYAEFMKGIYGTKFSVNLPYVAYSVLSYLDSEEYHLFKESFCLVNLSEDRNFTHRMKFLTSIRFQHFFSLRFCVAFILSSLEMVPDEFESASPFLQSLKQIESPAFFDALVSLSFHEDSFNDFLWTHMIPQVWNLLDGNVKEILGLRIETFLAQHLEAKVPLPRPLVIFTEGMLNCSPLPFRLPTIKSFGSRYNMWQKSEMLLLFENKLYSGRNDDDDEALKFLSAAYFDLNDRDLYCGLWKKYANDRYTKDGMSFEQQGLFKDATWHFYYAGKENPTFSKLESSVCTSSWTKNLQELSRWNLDLPEDYNSKLLSVGQNTDFCFCKSLKRTLFSTIVKFDINKHEDSFFDSSAANCPPEKCLNKQRSTKTIKILDRALMVILDEWKNLPLTISENHISVIQAMLKVKDIQDAYNLQLILQEKNEATMVERVQDTLQKWDSLKYSMHESMSFWNDVHSLRQRQLKRLQQDSLTTLGFQDETVFDSLLLLGENSMEKSNKQLAEVYLKHGHSYPCLDQLSRLTTNDLDTLKLTLEAYYAEVNNEVSPERKKILFQRAAHFYNDQIEKIENVRNSKDIDLIEAKLEEDRLLLSSDTGLQRLGDFSMFDVTCKHLEKIFFENREQNLDDGHKLVKCILEGCKVKSKEESVASMAKILLLLSIEGRLGPYIQENCNAIPISYFEPWIPELLTIFLDGADESVFEIIKTIAKEYPQSLYASLQSKKSYVYDTVPPMRCLEELTAYLQQQDPRLYSTLSEVYRQLSDFKKKTDQLELGILQEKMEEVKGAYCYHFKIGTYIKIDYHWSNLCCKIEKIEEFSDCIHFKDMLMEVRESYQNEEGFHALILFLSKWIDFYSEKSIKSMKNRILDSPYLLKYRSYDHEVKLPTAGLELQHSSDFQEVKILQFLPKVDCIKKFNAVTYRFFIKGDNGKVYPYTFVPRHFIGSIGRDNNMNHFLSCINLLFPKQREAVRYKLSLRIPDITTLSSDVFILRDEELSSLFTDICLQDVPRDRDPLINCYCLHESGLRLSSNIRLDIDFLYEVFCAIKEQFPETTLKEWAQKAFLNKADYFRFRKQFGRSMALSGLLQYTFYLTEQYPSNMLVHQDEGCITSIGFTFQSSKEGVTGSLAHVPFRLTPNISTFLTHAGVQGVFAPAMHAAAVCIKKYEDFVLTLAHLFMLHETLLFEEPAFVRETDVIAGRKEVMELVFGSTESIKEKMLSYQKHSDLTTKISELISKADDTRRMSLMDPYWYPWL